MNSYGTLYSQAKSAIGSITYNKIFYLRDLITNPPTGLGVRLYRDIAANRFNDDTYTVIHIGKDSEGVNLYKKVKPCKLTNE
jgi:hypothetical protein